MAPVVKHSEASSSTHKREMLINMTAMDVFNGLKIKEVPYRKQSWYTSEDGYSNKCKDKTCIRENEFPVSLSMKISRNLVVWMQLTCLEGRDVLLESENQELMEQA